MATSVVNGLGSLPAKKAAVVGLRGETARKVFSDAYLGRVVERAIALAGLTKDQAGREMGYANASTISRWLSGEESVQLGRVWAVEALRMPLIQALAEAAESGVVVETTVRLRRQTA